MSTAMMGLVFGIPLAMVVMVVIIILFAKRSGKKQERMVCPNCGQSVGKNKNFCTNCGAKMK